MYEKVQELSKQLESLIKELEYKVEKMKTEHYIFCNKSVSTQKEQGLKPSYSNLSMKIKKSTTSISFNVYWMHKIWFNPNTKRPINREIKLQRGVQTELKVLKEYSQEWEWEFVKEKELELRRIRKQVKTLGKALLYLRRLERELESGSVVEANG